MPIENDPRIAALLADVDVRTELEKIIDSVREVRADAAKQGAIPVSEIEKAAIKPAKLAEHDLSHTKMVVSRVKDHAVYEVCLKPVTANLNLWKFGKELVPKALGSAHDDHYCEWRRIHDSATVWEIWIADAFKDERATAFFTTVIPNCLNQIVVDELS